MSFLSRLIDSQKAKLISDWTSLESLDTVHEIIEESQQRTVIIFKHSTTCGLSAGAKYRLEENWTNMTTEVGFYYLDLLRFRVVSNAISDMLKVVHQSPQIIIIQNGKAIHHTSHHRVSVDDINRAMAQA